MAAGLLRALHGNQWEAFSAGTNPRGVHPDAVTVMAEIGIDISAHQSQHIASLRGRRFDLVVTVCDDAKESCPIFPGGTNRIHRSFPDPAAAAGTPEERLAFFRLIRDRLQAWIKTDALFTGRQSPPANL